MKFEHFSGTRRASYIQALLDVGTTTDFNGDLKLLIFAKTYPHMFRWMDDDKPRTLSSKLEQFNEVDQWVSCNVQRTFDTFTIRTSSGLVWGRWYGFKGEDDAFGFKMQWC